MAAIKMESVKARYRRNDVLTEVMRDWGGWARVQRPGLGSGGSVEQQARFSRPLGTHADPAFAEYMRADEDGQGLYRMIDARVIELHSQARDIIRARFIRIMSLQEIANAAQADRELVTILHDRAMGLLREAVRYYVNNTHDRAMMETYGPRIRAI
jgi:hypothetical protein